MTPKEHLIASLTALCAREGGHVVVADEIQANDQTIWQIINGVKLPSGNPRGVGPGLQAKLDARYPGWANLPSLAAPPATEGSTSPPLREPPYLALPQALAMLGQALMAADDLTLDQVRPLLARLVDEPGRAPEIVPRLSALLAESVV